MFKILLFLLGILYAEDISYKLNFNHTLTLIPQDSFTKIDNAQNVLQGIASYQRYWFVSQAVGKKRLLFNLLDPEGLSIANRQLNYASHGQDISVEKINNTTLYLYTVGRHNHGIARFKVYLPTKRGQKLDIRWDRELLKTTKNSTVTLSEDGRYFLSYYRGVVRGYEKETLKKIYQFRILKEQQQKWFQGIAMYGENIFTLSGNNRVQGKKIVAIYHKDGTLIEKYYIQAKDLEKRSFHPKDRWELEGLTLRDNKLYTTINYHIDGKNSKKLLEILTIEKRKNHDTH